MPVLLISRGTNSGGELIGHCLAESLGFHRVTREELFAAINAHGAVANRVLEGLPRAAREYGAFSQLRRPYKILMRMALLEYAARGPLAYFGYSGHFLLYEIPHFVKVRLIAPLAFRVTMTRERRGGTDEEARDFIRTMDEERLTWARFMYAKDLRDPAYYDLCINLRQASVKAACDLLASVARHPDFQPTPASQAREDDLRLATQVETALVTDPRTYEIEVAATAHAGTVQLQGPFLEGARRAAVLEVAGAVPGVATLDYQPGYAPSMDFAPGAA
jgi:hypothetical protein